MAKTSSTVHLEDSTWKEIKNYQDKYSCTRNEAIERMFVERRLLLTLNQGTNMNKSVEDPKEEVTAAIIESDNSPLDEVLDMAYDEMPD